MSNATKILILGSEGFIGHHLARGFVSMGYKVTRADIQLKEEDNYILINAELPDFTSIFSGRAFDVCINATGAANVQLSFNHPGIDYSLNVANVFQMLDAIRKYNPACKFINMSSAAVYGNPQELPIRETTPANPLSPYGCHKLYSENICREYHQFFSIPTTSLRIFSVFGEGARKQLFWDLYKKVSAPAETLELFGTGRESRDFIYIRDFIEAVHCIIENGSFTGDIINVASGVESTIAETVGFFVKAYGSRKQINFTGKDKKGDPLNWRADITRLKDLGFKSRYSLEEGINNYVKWVKESE